MPELPEVETIVRSLRHRIVGETISGAKVGWPRSIARPSPEALSQQVVGRRMSQVSRQGKFTIIRLDPDGFLVVHLGMTGHLSVSQEGDSGALDGHTRVLIRFASGKGLRFRDVRKFGRIYLVDDLADVPLLRDLGPDLLSEAFTARVLGELLLARRRQIKPLLLDQRLLAGLGNIYADESLWEARIHPATRSHTLAGPEVLRLHGAIRRVLSRAIQNRGTTLRDYRDPEGRPGGNQRSLSVYGRRGERCERCGGVIQRVVVGGRSTHLCPICQPVKAEAVQ